MSRKRRVEWETIEGKSWAELEISFSQWDPIPEHKALPNTPSTAIFVRSNENPTQLFTDHMALATSLGAWDELLKRLPIEQVEKGEVLSFSILDYGDGSNEMSWKWDGQNFSCSQHGVTAPLPSYFSGPDLATYLHMAAAKMMESLTWYAPNRNWPVIEFPRDIPQMMAFWALSYLGLEHYPILDDKDFGKQGGEGPWEWMTFPVLPLHGAIYKVVVTNYELPFTPNEIKFMVDRQLGMPYDAGCIIVVAEEQMESWKTVLNGENYNRVILLGASGLERWAVHGDKQPLTQLLGHELNLSLAIADELGMA